MPPRPPMACALHLDPAPTACGSRAADRSLHTNRSQGSHCSSFYLLPNPAGKCRSSLHVAPNSFLLALTRGLPSRIDEMSPSLATTERSCMPRKASVITRRCPNTELGLPAEACIGASNFQASEPPCRSSVVSFPSSVVRTATWNLDCVPYGQPPATLIARVQTTVYTVERQHLTTISLYILHCTHDNVNSGHAWETLVTIRSTNHSEPISDMRRD